MSKVSTNPPSGFRDFLPAESAARLELVETITRIYRSHGFQPIGMPMLENLSTLQGKGGGGENEKLIFKVMKRGEDLQRSLDAKSELADMGLRFDLTLPLARYCARFREQLPKPFKVFQIGPVWRADRPQKGRFREFFQCDVDVVGSKEIGAEVDCISAILEVFEAVGMTGVKVCLNDRRLLSAIGRYIGVNEGTWTKCLVTLDKLDKIGWDKVLAEILEFITAEGADASKAKDVLTELMADPSAANRATWNAVDAESYENLLQLKDLLVSLCGDRVAIDPSMVRGQDYYTGTIFEIRHADLSGSLGGGGRYNRLMEVFGAPETPAFGGSIGFERLVMLLQEQNKLGTAAAGPQVFFPIFGEDTRATVFQLSNELRKAGLRVDVFPDASVKFGKQLSYAEERKIPFALILGPDEQAKRQIKVKNMAARSEETISLETLSQHMVKLCNTV